MFKLMLLVTREILTKRSHFTRIARIKKGVLGFGEDGEHLNLKHW